MYELIIKYKWSFVTIIYLITAIFSEGYYHFDEHFQIIEFAGLKLGINQPLDMPWEYESQIRSAFQPLLVYIICKLFYLVNAYNPFHIALFLRILSALLAVYATIVFIKTFEPKLSSEKNRNLFFILSFFLWFAMFHKVRFSSENWSACIFMIGFSKYLEKSNHGIFKTLLLGFLLGLSFIIKFQVGFFIAGFMAWLFFVRKDKLKSLIFLFAGILLAIILGIVIDSWFYQQPVLTAWNYLQQLLFAKFKGSFDNQPWWYFFSETFNRAVPPFSIYIVLCFVSIFILRPKEVLTWVLVPFIFIHFFIGHKEIRFLFPVIPFIPFLMIYTHQTLSTQFKIYNGIVKQKITTILVQLFWIINVCLCLIVMFKSADSQIALYRCIYNNYSKPVTLYYIKNNPYERVLNVAFYKRKNLKFKHIDSINEIKVSPQFTTLFVSKENLKNDTCNFYVHPIYGSFPAWVKYLNFNDWLSRTQNWYVFEMRQNFQKLEIE